MRGPRFPNPPRVASICGRCWNVDPGHDGDVCVAEPVIVPPQLPPGARAPQLTIAAAPGPRGLSIEYTGTFPGTGAKGGYGAEVQYDTIYTDELEAHISEFVRLATEA